MLTKNNIKDFFEKYKKNLIHEDALNEALFKAEDQENWIENLRERSEWIRKIYTENETMLNLYIRPFLENGNRLTFELADEFLNQLLDMAERGYCDRVICIQMTIVLQKYFKTQGYWNRWMMSTHLLGNFYSQYSDMENCKKTLECFDIERRYFENYEDIKEWDIRRRVVFAFYNYAIVVVNSRGYTGQNKNDLGEDFQQYLIDVTQQAFDVMDSPKLRSLDGDKYDFGELKKELAYDVFGNWICGSECKSEVSPKMLSKASEILTQLYEEELAEIDSIYDMRDEIFCNYWKCEYFLDRIDATEFVEKLLDYFDHVLAVESYHSSEKVRFYDTRYFQINMYQIPNVCAIRELRENKALFERLKQYTLNKFKVFVQHMPKSRNVPFVNGPLKQALIELTRNLGTEVVDTYYFLNILVNRDEVYMIHASMVKRLALAILQKIFEKQPQLLVGMFGTQNVVDVLEKRDEFENFVTQASLFFDIGKIDYAELVNLQVRRLEKEDQIQLQGHSRSGYEMLQNMCIEQGICEVALGHHKSYDGKQGYPDDFDNTQSPVRFMIDLIRICDCMDAATDNIGRVYNKTKTLDEFMAEIINGAGFLYNPDIVTLIHEDEILFDELAYICSAGRIAIYYEGYHNFVVPADVERFKDARVLLKHETEEDLKKHAEESEHLLADIQEITQAQAQVLESLAKSTLLIARVMLDDDKISMMHNSGSVLLEDVKEGSFKDFIKNFGAEHVHPQDYSKLRRLADYGVCADYLYASEGNFELEIRVLEGENKWHWLRMQFVLAEEKDGIPQVLVLTISDIHNVKKQQQQFKEALEYAHKQAKQASEAKSLFLSSMSHDIRTPMNVIKGMTEIAKKHVYETERVQDCLEKIEYASDHLLQLINEVLDMSRIESGKMKLEEVPVSLKAEIEVILLLTQNDLDNKHLKRQVELNHISDDLVLLDHVRFKEILMNLMANAIKCTPEGGKIIFTAEYVRESEKYSGYHLYRFVIRDNGIGMSEDFLEKLFEPFAREEKVKVGKFHGTGLGLSIAKAYIEMMNGEIYVRSKDGQGSEFEILLPLRSADEQDMANVDNDEINIEDCIGMFEDRHILLAEDNDLNSEIFMELVADTGVCVERAQNGQDAVTMYTGQPKDKYDMIFMDIQMPVMTGYEATSLIRAYEAKNLENHRVPIIALTANAFNEDSVKAKEAGMDEHLVKPVEIAKILNVMKKYMIN